MWNVRSNNVLENIVNSLSLYKAKRNIGRVVSRLVLVTAVYYIWSKRIVYNNLESFGCDCTLLVVFSFQFGLGRKLVWIDERERSGGEAFWDVRQFTSDNDVSIEFDAYGFSVKDYQTGRILLRCDSTRDLYPVTQQPSSQTPVILLSFSSTTWHRRLGHPGDDVLRRLESRILISCHKPKLPALCHACQLASNKLIISRHVRFDEDVFPFENVTSSNTPTYDFLLPPIQTTTNVPTTEPFVQQMDEPNNPITPHYTAPPTSPPQLDTPPSHRSTPIPPQPDTPSSHSSTPIPNLRSLYGLKQASRAWCQRFASYATRVGFQHSKTDSSLFVFHRGSDIAYLLLDVDVIILTTSSLAFLQRIIASLHSEFAMRDLGSLNYFLGIAAQRSASGLVAKLIWCEVVLWLWGTIVMKLYVAVVLRRCCCGGCVVVHVKENKEKDKIGSKPDKNGKRGEARKCQSQIQSIKQEKTEENAN
uniref:Ribonuclease H-like domain-containing protein n=1 Tax=Tanacetum cinerariifolium TaxID=118510 RepID=A0A6L2K3T5_TANCI|nr:ribonuclease H-like domain-containing protein [Tanacetum cinerariifolium]